MVEHYQKRWYSLVAVYSATHFLVDFACAFLMFSFVAGTKEGYLCVLLYNFCAFAMQMPFGIIADKLNRNYMVAVIGCILVAAAYGFVGVPYAATIVIGLGNAMFHIGGGIDVLNISEKKLGALGVFVSPGAFGIYFGTMFGRQGGLSVLVVPIAIVAAAVLILAVYNAQRLIPVNREKNAKNSLSRLTTNSNTQRKAYPKNAEFSLEGIASGGILLATACFVFIVCLRSFVGLALDFSWKGTGQWGTALICAVVFGKTLGGFAADRFGTEKTAVISLGLAAVLFLFPVSPLAGVAAVLLFNMTMPITLWALARVMPGAKGFAFGLLTFGIFIGFLPVYLGVDVSSVANWLFALLAAVSLVILWLGLRRATK